MTVTIITLTMLEIKGKNLIRRNKKKRLKEEINTKLQRSRKVCLKISPKRKRKRKKETGNAQGRVLSHAQKKGGKSA